MGPERHMEKYNAYYTEREISNEIPEEGFWEVAKAPSELLWTGLGTTESSAHISRWQRPSPLKCSPRWYGWVGAKLKTGQGDPSSGVS